MDVAAVLQQAASAACPGFVLALFYLVCSPSGPQVGRRSTAIRPDDMLHSIETGSLCL